MHQEKSPINVTKYRKPKVNRVRLGPIHHYEPIQMEMLPIYRDALERKCVYVYQIGRTRTPRMIKPKIVVPSFEFWRDLDAQGDYELVVENQLNAGSRRRKWIDVIKSLKFTSCTNHLSRLPVLQGHKFIRKDNLTIESTGYFAYRYEVERTTKNRENRRKRNIRSGVSRTNAFSRCFGTIG